MVFKLFVLANPYKDAFALEVMQFWYSVQTAIREADIVVEVLDARLPELSRSADIEQMVERNRKQLLFVVNKSDLVSRESVERLQRELGVGRCVFVSGVKNLGMRVLKERLFMIGKKLGYSDPRVCFVGYPNVGKSSVINALAKRAKAKVSPHAGTTKGIQWISAGGLRIMDSPGVIPVEVHDEARIALMSARDPEKLKLPERAAVVLLKYVRENHLAAFARFYGIAVEGDENDLFIAVGTKKRFLKKGGEPIIGARRYRFCAIGSTARFHSLLEYFYNPEFFTNHQYILAKFLFHLPKPLRKEFLVCFSPIG